MRVVLIRLEVGEWGCRESVCNSCVIAHRNLKKNRESGGTLRNRMFLKLSDFSIA